MKYIKAILFTALLLFCVFGTFYFWILSESDSVSVWWQKALPWVAGACAASFIALVYWFSKSQKKW